MVLPIRSRTGGRRHIQRYSQRRESAQREPKLETRLPAFEHADPLPRRTNSLGQLFLRPAAGSPRVVDEQSYLGRCMDSQDSSPQAGIDALAATIVTNHTFGNDRCQLGMWQRSLPIPLLAACPSG